MSRSFPVKFWTCCTPEALPEIVVTLFAPVNLVAAAKGLQCESAVIEISFDK